MSNTPKKTSKTLKEMLSGLVGKLQTTPQEKFSVPKQYAIRLLDRMDSLALKHTQQSWTKQIWSAMKYYIRTKVIPSKTDKEVSEDLYGFYQELQEFWNKMHTADELKNSLTDKVINKKVQMLPSYKELAKLL